MTQEDKELLLKDICARLPYGVVAYASEINKNGIITDVNIPYNMVNLTIDNADGKYEPVPLFDIKPYLRPMSSMTQEEKSEFFEISGLTFYDDLFTCKKLAKNKLFIGKLINYLNSHHFDYNGLIEKGLALEAPEEMYK